MESGTKFFVPDNSVVNPLREAKYAKNHFQQNHYSDFSTKSLDWIRNYPF